MNPDAVPVPFKDQQDQIAVSSGRAAALLTTARDLKIADATTRAFAVNLRSDTKSFLKAVEDNRVALVKPLNDHVKRINDGFRKAAEPAEMALGIIDTEIRRDHQEQERRAAEARRKAEGEALAALEAAEARARLEREAEARAAAERGIQEAAAAGLSQQDAQEYAQLERADVEAKPMEVGPVPAPAYVAPVATTVRAEGGAKASVKKVWTFEVTAREVIPRAFLVLDEGKVRQAIRDGVRVIDGLRIYQKDVVSG